MINQQKTNTKNRPCGILGALSIAALGASVFETYGMESTSSSEDTSCSTSSDSQSDSSEDIKDLIRIVEKTLADTPKAEKVIESVWASFPSPSEAYANYLEYADDTRKILHDQKVTVVLADASEFDSLSGFFLKSPGYCSKLTIRNLDTFAAFSFCDDAIYRTVFIDAVANEARNVRLAFRQIVPVMYEDAPRLAGPLGFCEYLIDGSYYKHGYALELLIKIHPETPLIIELQNCKGYWIVQGPEPVKTKFKWDEGTEINFVLQ